MNRKCAATLCAAFLLLLCCLCGCAAHTNEINNDTLKIVCVSFPEYDWTRSLLGENPANIDLKLLISNGTDLHSYQATMQDIAEISSCDLLIHTGGVSGKWVEEAIESSRSEELSEVNMLRLLSDYVVEEELVEGMMPEDEHDSEESEIELDEHVWLSLRNAQIVCQEIANQLCALDGTHADYYEENLQAYTEKLSSLDAQYSEALSNVQNRTILVADRFPFRYLADDYDIEYYAAFAGCSAETDASFETVLFLAEKLDDRSLSCVFITEGSDARIANAVLSCSKDADREIRTLNSLQSVRSSQIEEGISYLDVMAENLAELSLALGA